MRVRRSNDGVVVNAIAGTNVVFLGMDLSAARRRGCLGFAVQREDHTEEERYWLKGSKTFSKVEPDLGPGGEVSTHLHPIQRFEWSDYSAKPGHEYTYTVVPMYGKPGKLRDGPKVKVRVETEPELGKPHAVFFNRGSVASQEYARRFQNKAPDSLTGEARDAAFKWLSRGLHEALLAFIARADGKSFGLYGAIYEFQWPDALDALAKASRSGADVQVLYDAIPGATGPRTKNRKAVRDAGITGLVTERTHGKIMHNKFLVLTRRGTPVAVWTGSTNWTENGIFAQFNNGHIVEDRAVAAAYLEYWHELCTDPADKNVEKAWMAEHNPEISAASKEHLQAVFSPHKGTAILDSYAELAGSARKALMMTFAFGMDERFKAVYRRQDDVLRFALMEKEGNGSGLAKAKVEIAALRRRANVVVAIGNRIPVNSFDRWLKERGPTGMVHWVHTKFMLVDPLSRNPVVVIGSANFSQASTNENNENMLVIRGDTRVADIYLGEYMRVRDHYGFREMVAKLKEGRWKSAGDPSRLEESPSWQDDWFRAGSERCRRREYFSGA